MAALEGIDIPLLGRDACLPPVGPRRAEWFVGEPAPPLTCDGTGPAPVVVVAIGGGGSDLLDGELGVSVGLIDIVNGVRAQAAAASLSSNVILMTAAIDLADQPQTRMEQWLAADLRHRMEALPCLRAVLIGHSHGAVLATSVLAALDARFGARLYGVVMDRSLLYYDRHAVELPQRASILNVYQTNEGWHGKPPSNTSWSGMSFASICVMSLFITCETGKLAAYVRWA